MLWQLEFFVVYDDVSTSHLFYAETPFLGEWDELNIRNIIRILRCFHLILGLRINLIKSNLFGVGVNDHEVSTMAIFTGCSFGYFFRSLILVFLLRNLW